MGVRGARSSWAAVLSLRATRRLLSGRLDRFLVAASALLYVGLAVLVGGMLQIEPDAGATPAFLWLIPRGPGGDWSYPAILAGGPYFRIDLPLVSTIFMVLTAAGVGLGMAAGIGLLRRLYGRAGERAGARSLPASTLGLAPALLGLLTLGACCSTAAAATAGVELVGLASGASPEAIAVNAWYLAVFQLAAVYVALLAQEQIVLLFGFIGGDARPAEARPDPRTGPFGLPLLRAFLVGAGLVWALSGFTYWFAVPLTATGQAAWFAILLQHGLSGLGAVALGLFPAAIGRALGRGRSMGAWAGRVGLGLGATATLAWTPAALSGAGAPGLLNALAAEAGMPSRWGATGYSFGPWAPAAMLLAACVGGWGIALAVRPMTVAGLLTGRTVTSPAGRAPSAQVAPSEAIEPV